MGFETELFVEQPVDQNLICNICTDVLEKPTTICAEGHMFCTECIAGWQHNKVATCPTCREKIISNILCRPVQNIIMELKVQCPEIADFEVKETKTVVEEKDSEDEESENEEEEASEPAAKRARKEGDEHIGGASKHQRSLSVKRCDWIGSLSDYLEKHRLHECAYRQVECPLGCEEMIRCCDLESHQTTKCPHRIISCRLCKQKMKQLALADHSAKQCPEQSARCHYCGDKMLRKELGTKPAGYAVDDPPQGLQQSSIANQYSGHYKTCPNMRVSCDFHDHGCHVILKRQDLDKHNAKYARVHVLLVNEAMKRQHEESKWTEKEIYWRIPEEVIEEALEDPDLLHVKESQRVKVGDYMAFLRLMIDEGVVHVKACVDRPPFSPSIDGLAIEVVDDADEESDSPASAALNMEEEQQMSRDAGASRTWSVGGPLRFSSGKAGAQERDTLIRDLEEWTSRGYLELRAGFRLKGPDSVIVECKSRNY